MTQDASTHSFEADVSQVLRLVIHSLYSNPEIFLRELVSNASDALDKLRFEAVTQPALLGDEPLRIRIAADEDAGTLTISDNGIGMSRDELARNLGTVAHSGTKEFLRQLAEGGDAASPIGQFGVGFYSAYLVADEVTVISRRAGSSDAFRWISTGEDGFSIEPGERDERGTDITLKLKESAREFLSSGRLRALVRRYSDFVGHPIELREGAGEEARWQQVNRASALWRRAPREVEDEQYDELYKHLTHDGEPPLAKRHFRLEGRLEFAGVLFVPRRPPFDLFQPDAHHGVRLYVKRVFIMDDCAELLPRWLRFVRGVIDSEDLPLNVSRELLQDSGVVRTMRKQVVKYILDMIEELAGGDGDDYLTFWKSFGAVLKEGLHLEPAHRERLRPLLRYPTTHESGWTSLAEYVGRMPEDQPALYYAQAASREVAERSPHLEGLRARGYEVLLMTDPVDAWVTGELGEVSGKALVSVTDGELELPPREEREPKSGADLDGLVARFQEVLEGRVTEVRCSERLVDSPVCLVSAKGALPPHLERAFAQMGQGAGARRALEINPQHELIRGLGTLHQREPSSEEVRGWIELLHDQAALAEGSPLSEPASFVTRVTELLEEAVARRATSSASDS